MTKHQSVLTGLVVISSGLLIVTFIKPSRPPISNHRAVSVVAGSTEIFNIATDGTMILRGKVIAKDKQVADLMLKAIQDSARAEAERICLELPPIWADPKDFIPL